MDNEEINLIEYWRATVRHKKMIGAIVGAITLFITLYSLYLPNIYESKAVILPLGGQKGGVASAFAQMGLGGLVGSLGGGSASTSQFMVILKSRTLAMRIIEKYGLLKVFHKNAWDEKNQKWKEDDPKKQPNIENSVGHLLGMVSFDVDQEGPTIEVKVDSQDPQFAAEIANIYAKELGNYISENMFSSAKKNRIFIEQQLQRTRVEFLEAGKALTDFYVTNKVSNVIPTVDVDISIPREKDKIESHDPKLLGQVPFLKEDPSVSTSRENDPKTEPNLEDKIKALESQLDKIRIVPGVPQQVYLQYLMLRRELLGQVNTLLTQQYEMAKINESKDDLNFEVLDWAHVPTSKLKPVRSQMVMIGLVVGLLLGVSSAFAKDYYDRMKAPHMTIKNLQASG